MNIDFLFPTKERIKIINNVIFKTSSIGINSIAREIGLSKALVSKYFSILEKEGIVKKADRKFIVNENIKTKAIKLLLNLSSVDASMFRDFSFIKSAGLYGSFVKGANTENSDIDLWILTEAASEEHLAAITKMLKDKFINARLLYLTREKINKLKTHDPVFYHSLIFGSIVIYGDGIEAI